MKRIIYTFFVIIFMTLLSAIIHFAVFGMYSAYFVSDVCTLTYNDFLTSITLTGAIIGFIVGQIWWKIIYVDRMRTTFDFKKKKFVKYQVDEKGYKIKKTKSKSKRKKSK